MSSIHLRNALSMLEELLQRDDLSGEIKSALQRVRREVMKAQDEIVWARGRAKEAYYVLEELLEILGAEARLRRVHLSRELHEKLLEVSPHVEAVINESGKVRIERVAVVSRSGGNASHT